MNCKAARDLMFLDVDGELAAAQHLALREHRADCADCRVLAADVQAEAELLNDALAPPAWDQTLSSELASRINAGVRAVAADPRASRRQLSRPAVVLAATVGVVLAVASGVWMQIADSRPYGRVAEVAGKASIWKSGTQAWRGIALDDAVRPGDMLRTGVDGGMVVEFDDGSTLELNPSTGLTLGERSAKARRPERARLPLGDVVAFVQPGGGLFEFETPSAVAEVMGTRFLLSARAMRTGLVVLAGAVNLGNDRGQVTAEADDKWAQRVIVVPSGPPPEPEPLPHSQVQELIDQLDDPEFEVRGGAAAALMRIARKDADRLQPVIGRLIEAVDDDNGNVRGSAAMALAWIACNIQDKTVLTATVTPLLDTLRDPASKGRREAAGALGWVGTRVEDDTAFAPAYLTLIEMLQGDSQVLRNAAAMPIATGTFSVSDEAVLRPAIDPLTRALQDEGFGEMRWATANGLAHIAGRVPDPEAFGATIPVLADCLQDDALANSAAHALQVIVSVLQTEETLEPALPAFLGALTRTDDSYWLARWRAAQGLGYAADMVEDQASLDAMVSALTVALADPHTDVRAMAAWALGRVARATTKPDALDPAIEPLIEVLRTATSVVPLKPKGLVPPISLVGRTLAVSASGSPEALVTALDVLTDGLYHEDPSVRAAAADALAWVAVEAGDQSVVARAMAHLTDALGDQDPYVAWIATFALARLAPNVEKESVLEAPVPMLLDMLQDEAAHMRWAAARALAALAQHVDDSMAMEAAASLSAALRDRRAHVRWAAADALAAVASSAAGERATGGAAIALAGALADSHPRVRRAAARALAEPSVPTSAGVSLAESTFDTDDEGWTYFGPAFNVTHHNTGGAPGSYLAADDQAIGNPWGWLAPQKFLGHMSSAYGGTLDFDLRRMVMMESEHKGLKVTDVQIVLIGGGLRLQLMAPNNPGPDWTSYSIPLEPDVGWRRGGGGASKSPPATESDLRSVLSELQAVRIRVGPNHPWTRWDRTGMDNVVLTSGPTGDG